MAGVSLALLIGKKPIGLAAVPILFAVCLLTYRGVRLVAVIGVGLVSVCIGGAWYVGVNLLHGKGLFGDAGETSAGQFDVAAIAARSTGYMVETVDVPARGRDLYVYALVAAAVAVGGLALRRGAALVLAAAALALVPLAAPPLERVLHSVYVHGWTLVGYPAATALDPIRASSASNLGRGTGRSVSRDPRLARPRHTGALRGTFPWVGLALCWSPLVVLVATAVAVPFHTFDGAT